MPFFRLYRKARFNIEAARLGRDTDYDRLIMEIFTDGSMRPDETISLAAQILRDQFSLFIDFEDTHVEEDDKQDEQYEEIVKNLGRGVDELELSMRSQNCLKNSNIKKIYELVKRSETEMLKTKNFGKKSLKELEGILESMGLHFNMDVTQYGFPARDKELDKENDSEADELK